MKRCHAQVTMRQLPFYLFLRNYVRDHDEKKIVPVIIQLCRQRWVIAGHDPTLHNSHESWYRKCPSLGAVKGLGGSINFILQYL